MKINESVGGNDLMHDFGAGMSDIPFDSSSLDR
jgi:hypothetical protein